MRSRQHGTNEGDGAAEDIPLSTGSLDRPLVRGVAWTGGGRWAIQGLTWVTTIVMARLLAPADYGIVGLAGVYLGLIAVITEGGLGASIVALRHLDSTELAEFNGLSVLFGVAGLVLTCTVALPLGLFFRSEELPAVTAALSLSPFLSALRVVPNAVLKRQFRFRSLAALDVLTALVSSLSGIIFALLGLRYWSLVASGLLSFGVAAVVSARLARVSYAWPRRAGIGRHLPFTRDLLVGRLAWYVYNNADFAVAGRVLGAVPLGAYQLAWTLANVPVEKIAAIVTRVTPAVLGRLQANQGELRRVVLLITEALAFVTVPSAIGLGLVAADFVPVVLGPKWEGSILPLQLLTTFAAFRSLATILSQALTAVGESRFLMWNGILTAIGLPLAFLAGSHWGAGGIAATWLVAYPLFAAPLYYRAFRAIDIDVYEYVRQFFPMLRGCVAMVGVVIAMRLTFASAWPADLRLFASITAGALSYAAVTVFPERHRIRQLLAMLRAPDAPSTVGPTEEGG